VSRGDQTPSEAPRQLFARGAAAATGRVVGSCAVTRFVILGHPRCGSFLLLYALNQHPRIVTFAELFLRWEPSRRDFHAIDGGRWYRDGDDGAAFLRDAVYVPRGERDVIGFKLFYEQAPARPAASAWDYLAGERDLRVIHLYREQLLESLVSQEIAKITDEWMVHRGAAQPPRQLPPFELSPERCRQHFDTVLADRRRALDKLAGLPRLEIEYRALCDDFDTSVAACCRHLGVAPIRAEKQLVKQAARPVREQVANYDALVRHFAATPYARYF